MGRFSDVSNKPGVYALFDLDRRPLYVGQSTRLRTRLEQHFIRQDSSATADGLLDIYDVLFVAVWYVPPELELFKVVDSDILELMQPLEVLEAAVYKHFQPRWNRARLDRWKGPMPTLKLDNADIRIDLLDDAEIAVRQRPPERIEAKLLHLLRATRKAKISGASPKVKRALSLHAEELLSLFRRLHE